MDLKKDFTA